MSKVQDSVESLVSNFKEITEQFNAYQVQDATLEPESVRKLTEMSFEAQKKLGFWLLDKTKILSEPFAQFNRAVVLSTEKTNVEINTISHFDFYGYPFSFKESREELIAKLEEFNVKEPHHSAALDVFDLRTAMIEEVQNLYGILSLQFILNRESDFLCIDGYAKYAYHLPELQDMSGKFVCKLSF